MNFITPLVPPHKKRGCHKNNVSSSLIISVSVSVVVTIIILGFLSGTGTNALPRKRGPPRWNYLIQSSTPEPVSTTTEDILKVPSLDFLIKHDEDEAAEEKTNFHDSSPHHHHHHHHKKHQSPSALRTIMQTSRNALVNYFHAVKKMVTNDDGKSNKRNSNSAEHYGNGNSKSKRRTEPNHHHHEDHSDEDQYAPTRFGMKQEYDKYNRVKAVMVRGDMKDTDGYLEEEKGGWGVGDAMAGLFWSQIYGKGDE